MRVEFSEANSVYLVGLYLSLNTLAWHSSQQVFAYRRFKNNFQNMTMNVGTESTPHLPIPLSTETPGFTYSCRYFSLPQIHITPLIVGLTNCSKQTQSYGPTHWTNMWPNLTVIRGHLNDASKQFRLLYDKSNNAKGNWNIDLAALSK